MLAVWAFRHASDLSANRKLMTTIKTLQSNERIRGAVLEREDQKASMRQTRRVDQVFWLMSGGRQRARICEPW